MIPAKRCTSEVPHPPTSRARLSELTPPDDAVQSIFAKYFLCFRLVGMVTKMTSSEECRLSSEDFYIPEFYGSYQRLMERLEGQSSRTEACRWPMWSVFLFFVSLGDFCFSCSTVRQNCYHFTLHGFSHVQNLDSLHLVQFSLVFPFFCASARTYLPPSGICSLCSTHFVSDTRLFSRSSVLWGPHHFLRFCCTSPLRDLCGPNEKGPFLWFQANEKRQHTV